MLSLKAVDNSAGIDRYVTERAGKRLRGIGSSLMLRDLTVRDRESAGLRTRDVSPPGLRAPAN